LEKETKPFCSSVLVAKRLEHLIDFDARLSLRLIRFGDARSELRHSMGGEPFLCFPTVEARDLPRGHVLEVVLLLQPFRCSELGRSLLHDLHHLVERAGASTA
jgi:hypothetical protein